MKSVLKNKRVNVLIQVICALLFIGVLFFARPNKSFLVIGFVLALPTYYSSIILVEATKKERIKLAKKIRLRYNDVTECQVRYQELKVLYKGEEDYRLKHLRNRLLTFIYIYDSACKFYKKVEFINIPYLSFFFEYYSMILDNDCIQIALLKREILKLIDFEYNKQDREQKKRKEQQKQQKQTNKRNNDFSSNKFGPEITIALNKIEQVIGLDINTLKGLAPLDFKRKVSTPIVKRFHPDNGGNTEVFQELYKHIEVLKKGVSDGLFN